MLSRITIRNLVIVKGLDLAFAPGMTTLTGETGAGKSILIDALGLALGDKADNGLIRNGADKAEISAAFDIGANGPIAAWLDDNDLAADGECLLRRVLVREGRSRAYVNGSPIPVATLRELGGMLLDIHGQHAHQSLLRPRAQRELVDAYGGLQPQARKLAGLYQVWRDACRRLEALQQAGEDRAKRLDYLAYQIAELEGLVATPDELQALEADQARLAHADRLLADGARVLGLLHDDEPSLQDSLGQAVQMLDALTAFDSGLAEARELLDTASIQIDEAAGTLRHCLDRIEPDPERLQLVDERLGRLHEAARKHRVEPEALGALLDDLKAEADSLDDADATLQRLAAERDAGEAAYRSAAAVLGEARRGAAQRLAETVTASMQQLGMHGGRFGIDCTDERDKPGPHGTDRVLFRVATNPGQPMAALADVVSGGELSRISLAIQVATANCGQVPTLIFDEVDVGIGGATAEIVGQLLRRLGEDRQVLCVTHLPQVASQAHRQMRVQKLTDGTTTETRIEALDATARIDELARMLGGVDITEQTRRHAREMIQAAQKAS